MGAELLVIEQIDAGAAFVQEFDKTFSVSVAFWIIPADSDKCYLYVASDQVDANNIKQAYAEVHRLLGGRKNQWLDPFQIRLVNSSDQIACDAVKIRDWYPAPLATWYNGSSIGGVGIDSAYIYRSDFATKTTQ